MKCLVSKERGVDELNDPVPPEHDPDPPIVVSILHCRLWRRSAADGKTHRELANEFGRGQSTITRHIAGDCSHNKSQITPVRCGVLRCMAADGKRPKIQDTFSFVRSEKAVERHIYGKCGCQTPIPPLTPTLGRGVEVVASD